MDCATVSQIPVSLPASILRRARAAERKHPDALVAILSAEGLFLYNSASSEEILGYPPGYALGHNITEFYQPREAAHIMLTIHDALLAGESTTTTRNSPLAKGGTRRIRGSMYRVVDPTSGVAYALSVAWPATSS
jgi:hypothetical protein